MGHRRAQHRRLAGGLRRPGTDGGLPRGRLGPPQVEETFARTTAECGPVEILINCAGIITGNKTFDRQTPEEIERTMAVNATAPMYLTLQALPGMLERNEGHICNIASAAGMISNPRMSVYAASKWAVIGWVGLPAHRSCRRPAAGCTSPP